MSFATQNKRSHQRRRDRYDDGQPLQSTIGGITHRKKYDTLGRIKNIDAYTGATFLQQSSYQFDQLGNLTSRSDAPTGQPSIGETYTYDRLNRLSTSQGSGGNKTTTYDDSGSLLTKTGITGSYSYYPNSHQVQSVNSGGQLNTYLYDNNGNLTVRQSGGTFNRAVIYTPFNLPASINQPAVSGQGPGQGAATLAYDYDDARSRIVEVATTASAITKTTYIGSQYFEVHEKTDTPTAANPNPTPNKQYKHYIASPDGVIGILTISPTDTSNLGNTGELIAGFLLGPNNPVVNAGQLHYWLRDHLSSNLGEYQTAYPTNPANAITSLQRQSFDAWGLRRLTNAQDGSPTNLSLFSTQRGFTGHEMLDEVGIIHMNGRLYDPVIGRFMQADPIIQSPYDGQNFNRYSYVFNNPLSFSDPSGYSAWTNARDKWVKPIAAIAVAYWISGFNFTNMAWGGAGSNGLAGAVAGGFAAGGINGGNLNSALQGAFSAALFYGAGSFADAIGGAAWAQGGIGRVAAHAVAGCTGAAVAGGSCKAGAMSAGFAEFAGPRIDVGSDTAANITKQAILGGAGSRISGGNFTNGAVTGAFGYLFNCIPHGCQSESKPSGPIPIGDTKLLAEGVQRLSNSLSQMFDDVWDNYIAYNWNYRERALKAAGMTPNSFEAKNYEVHHIVQQAHPGAATARANLAKVGIGIHDLENLVVLRVEAHRGVHTDAYRSTVNSFTSIGLLGGRVGVSTSLLTIRASLVVGKP